MRTHLLMAAGVLALVPVLGAQQLPRAPTMELRPFAGVYVPTGAMRRDFGTATTLGAQGALELSRHWHVLGSVGWTHGHNKLALGSDVTYLWQYDVGVEANLVRALGTHWLLRPFAGVGGGGRTYDYRAAGVSSRTCTAGYGALGTELQRGAMAVRLEGRDYLTCFESPATGRKHTRNDFGVTLGLAYHLR